MLTYSCASSWQESGPPGEPRLRAIAGWNDGSLPLGIHVHCGLEVGLVLAGEEHMQFGDAVFTCGAGTTEQKECAHGT